MNTIKSDLILSAEKFLLTFNSSKDYLKQDHYKIKSLSNDKTPNKEKFLKEFIATNLSRISF